MLNYDKANINERDLSTIVIEKYIVFECQAIFALLSFAAIYGFFFAVKLGIFFP